MHLHLNLWLRDLHTLIYCFLIAVDFQVSVFESVEVRTHVDLGVVKLAWLMLALVKHMVPLACSQAVTEENFVIEIGLFQVISSEASFLTDRKQFSIASTSQACAHSSNKFRILLGVQMSARIDLRFLVGLVVHRGIKIDLLCWLLIFWTLQYILQGSVVGYLALIVFIILSLRNIVHSKIV